MPEPITAGIAGGAALLGTGANIYASNRAASQQARAARDAAASAEAIQREMLERQIGLQAPFRAGGMAAQNRLMTLLGLRAPTGEEAVPGLGVDISSPDFGRYARDFGVKDFQTDPGYAFRLSEGMKALERSAAARGGLLSGAALRGTQTLGQDLASQEYMNAFNRYQTNRANQLNPLQSLMGAGQSAANTLTAATGQAGQGIANTNFQGIMGAGQARASGYMGTANALNQGLSTGANLYLQAPLYKAMAQYYQRPSYGLVSGANVGGPGGL